LPELEKKFRVFIPDLPGHGLSPLTDAKNFSAARNNALIRAFIKYVKTTYKCRGVILVGHSYGSFAVLSVTAEGAAGLSGVVGLAAIDDYAPYTPRLKRVLMIPAFLVGIYYRLQALWGLFPYGDRMLLYGQMPAELIPGRLAYAKIKNKALSVAASHAYMKAFVGSLAMWPAQKIRTPAMLIYGEKDQLTSSKWAQKILPHFSHASVETIPDAGHNVQISGAESVARLLRQFAEKSFRPRR
jgi:pimeloyl-ACP methyl ester carboxylesterase